MKHLKTRLLSLLLLPFAAPVWAADFVELEVFGNGSFDLGLWAMGDGTQSFSHLNCAGSADTKTKKPKAKDNRMPYRFQLTDLSSPPGYYLYLDGDDTNTGNARIYVQWQHRDVREGTAYEPLADGLYDNHAHLGQFRNCPDGDNSEILATISSLELQKARAGSYQGQFEGQIIGGSKGTRTDAQTLSLSISVANIVRITALDNIGLGLWDGVNNMVGSETFCVYSNNTAAAYQLTFSSSQMTGAGEFRLADAGQTEYLTYSVTFNDAIGAGAGTTIVGGVPVTGAGNNTDPGCSGTDNATVTVNVAAADLSSVTPQIYGDTLTILVAPQ